MSLPLVLVALALLLTAAWRDIATRTIPDVVSLLLLSVGGVARLLEGLSDLALSAGTSLVLFVLLLVVYSRGFIGGGDVKIMTAFAIGLSPLDSYRFVVATAIAGGFLGVVYLLLSRMPLSVRPIRRRALLIRIIAIEAWRIHRSGPLPYGVAVAAGGAFVLLHPCSF
jgi:prepilin peptidase CpaA